MAIYQTQPEKHIKQKLTELKGKTDKPTIIVGDPLLIIDRIRQKISNDIEEFNKNINQNDLIGIYRTLH